VRFESPDADGLGLRLGYCLNLHAAEDLAGILRGLREVTLPLRERLAPPGRFGVGMYLPEGVALELASPAGESQLDELAAFLAAEGLDPFTFNAFPIGGFHRDGLKRAVFEPTWCDERRVEYTLAVARVAALLNARCGGAPGRPLPISTHPGRFGPFEEGELEAVTRNLAHVLRALAELHAQGGPAVRLALEAEPRAVAGDTGELAHLLERLVGDLASELGDEPVRAHLGACLDACHSAVEFEDPRRAVELATGLPLGKLQYSSALALSAPGESPAARARLLALDEPRYLHQTTGRYGGGLLRVDDLPELSEACAAPDSPWLACEEWRTHFHVPVDLEVLGDEGLRTTRDHARAILATLLVRPELWGGDELAVEIETYTWDILPDAARGSGDLVEGLEREYRHVLGELESAGWRPVDEPESGPPGA